MCHLIPVIRVHLANVVVGILINMKAPNTLVKDDAECVQTDLDDTDTFDIFMIDLVGEEATFDLARKLSINVSVPPWVTSASKPATPQRLRGTTS